MTKQLIAILLAAAGVSAAAQQPRPAQAQPVPPQQNGATAPDIYTVTRLIWSAMAAVDHANRTGNYSVLRDLGSPRFQASQTAASLGTIFEGLRKQQVDLSYTLNVAPVYDFAPTIQADGMLRARGRFPLRPISIAFDLLFENVQGQWRIFGIAVAPIVDNPPSPPKR